MSDAGAASAATSLFGFRVALMPLPSAVDEVLALSQSPGGSYVVTMNADHVVKLNSDDRLRSAYCGADVRFVDGMPVYWLATRRAAQHYGRVAGSDLLPAVLRESERLGLGVYVVGGPVGQQSWGESALRRKYPGLRLLGWEAPWLDASSPAAELSRSASHLITANPDVVVVALGAPKQEYWAQAVAPHMRKGVILPIGAGLEFVTGARRRAPKVMRATGLEWAWRLAMEPRRLGKRYLVGNFSFLALCLATKFGSEALPINRKRSSI